MKLRGSLSLDKGVALTYLYIIFGDEARRIGL